MRARAKITSKALFMVLILIATNSQSVLAIDEVVDNYTDETKIAGKHQVVRNTTFDAMELNYGYGIGLAGWNYRKLHNITGSTTDNVTDYQIMIGIDYGAGSDSGSVVYLDGKCQADFDDIRFTDSDGTTELDYYLEYKTDSDSAIFWVKNPTILQSSAITSFYIYYGNLEASSTSNGNNTFPIFFDDFLGNSLNLTNWNAPIGGEYSVSDSTLTITQKDASRCSILSQDNFGYPLAIHFRMKVNDQYGGGGMDDNAGTNRHMQLRIPTPTRVALYSIKLGATTTTTYEWDDWGTFHSFSDEWYLTKVKYYLDNSLQKTHDTNIPLIDLYIKFFSPNINDKSAFLDWVFIRNYIDPEPTHGGWGLEEFIGTGYRTNGHFYTTDLLDGISYGTVAMLLNSTIPDDDSLTVEFSQDNSTWVDHNGVSGGDTVIAGYEAIDLRDLGYTTIYSRFNLSDGGADSTPRLHQLRLIHNAPAVNTFTGSSGIFALILCIIIPIVAYVMKKR